MITDLQLQEIPYGRIRLAFDPFQNDEAITDTGKLTAYLKRGF